MWLGRSGGIRGREEIDDGFFELKLVWCGIGVSFFVISYRRWGLRSFEYALFSWSGIKGLPLIVGHHMVWR